MAVNLSMLAGAGAQFFTDSGVPLTGGLVYTYAAGTTTPQATYTTSAGSTAHANPIVLDSAGRVPSGGEIWLTDAVAYKFVLKTSAAVTIATYDNVVGNASGIYAAFAASSGSSLVGYIQSGTGAVATTVQTRLRQSVSVLDFMTLSDVGTTNDVTYAFNAAINAAATVYVPNGTYYVSNVALKASTNIIGQNRDSVIIVVRTSSTAAFYNANYSHIKIANLTIKANTGVTNAIGYNQPDTANYSAWAQFENLYTWANLSISFNGLFIFTRWDNCQDGEAGSPPVAQYHQAIKSIPAAYLQGNTTNVNQVIKCNFNNSDDPNGAVYIGWGNLWAFKDCDFEVMTTTAINLLGIYGVTIDNCWFENITATNVIVAQNEPTNSQGTSPVSVQNCFYNGNGTNTYFLSLNGAATGSVVNLNATSVAASCKLTNVSTLNELYGVFARSGAGASGFTTGITATRANLIINTSTINSPTITTPAVTNQNVRQGAINGTTPTVTPINVNAAGGGKTVLLFFSFSNSTGNATASSLWMIRCGYDGNNYTATKIVGDVGGAGASRDTPTFTVSGTGVLSIACFSAGDGYYGILSSGVSVV